MMYSTVPLFQQEFELQLSIIIKQIKKTGEDQKLEDKVCLPDGLRENFKESFFSIMTAADDHIPAKQLGNHSDESFI